MKRILSLCAALLIAVAVMAQEGPKRYGIKSGTVKNEMQMMGQTLTMTIYFDDYGALESGTMDIMGTKVTQISRDGKMYTINGISVQEMPLEESINYNELTDEVIAKYKIKEVGTEVVAGKECIKYTAEISQMGQTAHVTVSVWKGYPMKNIIEAGGLVVTNKVVEIKEGPVDASLFELPKR